MKYRVSNVADNEARVNLISFQNGRISTEGCHKAKCGISKEKQTGKIVATVTNNDGFVYRGYERSDVNRHAQILLAVRNRNTHKVRLFPVSSFLLNPILQGPEKSAEAPIENEKILHKELGRAFGSKKTKRSVEYAARMATGMESLKSQLNSAVSQVSTNEDLLKNVSSEKDEIATYLPPCNREADKVEDVYKLYDMITAEELDALRQEAIRIIKETDQNSAAEKAYKLNPAARRLYSNYLNIGDFEFKFRFSPFFRTCLPKLANVSGTEMLIQLCILLYTESLISFLKLPARRLQAKRLVVCPYSVIINQKILNDFTSQSDRGRVRPNSLKDKAICYIIVFGLLLCNYELDLQLLSQSIGTPIKRLVELSRAVGAVLKSKESATVVLKLPLPELQLSSIRMTRSQKR